MICSTENEAKKASDIKAVAFWGNQNLTLTYLGTCNFCKEYWKHTGACLRSIGVSFNPRSSVHQCISQLPYSSLGYIKAAITVRALDGSLCMLQGPAEKPIGDIPVFKS